MNGIRFIVPLLISISVTHAQERITLFTSDITVQSDNIITVHEQIEVISEQQTIIHGIVREFPTKYREQGLHYNVDFKVLSVTHNDTNSPFDIQMVGNGTKVYIRDKQVKIAPGKHSYSITYQTNRQIGFFENYDELYWNVTGNGWRLPIEKVIARVHLPAGITQQKIYAQAYTGYQGKQQTNYSYTIQGDQVLFVTTRAFKAYEGLTIAVGFPKGFVQEPSDIQRMWWLFRDNPLLILFLLGLLLCGILLSNAFITTHRKNKPGNVIPLFYPPAGMLSSDVGFMSTMGFNNRLLSADIVHLAVSGFITIHGEQQTWYAKTYTLTKNAKAPSPHNDYEHELLTVLFKEQDSIVIAKKFSPTLKNALELCKQHTEGNYASSFTMFKQNLFIEMMVIFVTTCTGVYLFSTSITAATFVYILFILMGIYAFFQKFFSVYTPEGRKLQDAIDGFKLYLTTAEVDRMHLSGTPPTKTPELYEKYLPYAIALNVEKQWTAQFSSLFNSLDKEHTYRPHWYHGHLYTLDSLSTDIASSFTNTISSASTPPGKSSGSGGRGSSGGGGGGGGGGGC